MHKRVLMISTIASTIGQFNISNIHLLQSLGYDVDVAADFTDQNVWSAERISSFKSDMADIHVRCFQVDFSRSPLRIDCHSKSYKEVLKLIQENHYSFIHTHTPIASAIVRMAAKKMGIKVIYTAHGFHFYDGAPVKNWIIFYPVEKWLSKYTDVLITINKEDYERAKKNFNAKETVYVPGVGVDTEKFKPRDNGRARIREELGLDDSRTMLLSVGELNANKNHANVIRAISGLNITYVIVGKGEKANELRQVACEEKVDLRLTGFRDDVVDFYDAADIYILPSIREGLNVSLMEAMASGLPCACGNIRGNKDLIDDKGGRRFNPLDIASIQSSIKELTKTDRKAMGAHNLEKIKAFDLSKVNEITSEIYNRGRLSEN